MKEPDITAENNWARDIWAHDIRAVAFDVNGTLVEIRTDEGMEQIYRSAGHTLTYAGISLRRGEVRDLYNRYLKQQKADSPEKHAEYDAVGIWRRIVEEHASDYTRSMPPAKLAELPTFLAELTRGVSRRRLALYPNVRAVLTTLRTLMPIAVVTDAQSAWARAEMNQVGLLEYFDTIVVSGDHGFRKPDTRLFQYALDAMGVPAAQTLYVGNDMYRDIFGAREAGMRTAMFTSDQGTKEHRDCRPDFMIDDHLELLDLLGIPRP